MFERNLQYFGPLKWDAVSGFAINPDAPGGSENAFSAKDFRNILAAIVGTGTVKVYGSIQRDPPDFTSPSIIGNSWDTIMTADYQAVGTYYTGAAGVNVSASTKIVEVNTNLLTWIGFHRDANTVDVDVTVTDNI